MGEASLHLLFDLAAALLFIISSGLVFNEKFRQNYVAVGCAAIIATLSSYFVFEELKHRFSGPAVSSQTLVRWNAKGTDNFSAADLARLKSMMQANACRLGCTDDRFSLFRLPLESERPAYLVSITEPGWCGSGGCMGALMILVKDKLYVVKEDLGLTDRQAMLIAREVVNERPE